MDNFEYDKISSIINNLIYDSPYNTVFDTNVDSLSLDGEQNPSTIYVEKISSGLYSCSVVYKNGKMFIEPISITVADFSSEHITLFNRDISKGLTFYFINDTVAKIIFFDTGDRDAEIFVDFASNNPDFAQKPHPSPMLLYEIALNLYNKGDKNKATTLFFRALSGGGYISPSLALMTSPFSAENIPLCKANLLDCC